MTDLRKAAEMALEFVEWLCGDDHSIKPKNNALKTREALRQALAQTEKPPVKSYCGGKPNYCTPEVTPEVTTEVTTEVTEEVGACVTCGAPKGEWLVDAVNMSQERVDERAKGKHKREWVGLTDADKQEAFDETQEASGGFWEFADYLEAKLKEKNT